MLLMAAGVLVVAILAVAIVWASLYQKASPEQALVRTGQGGVKVQVSGGLVVIPIIHILRKVNMKTLGLEVAKSGESALISKDRMRVDTTVKFYVRVNNTAEDIAMAAQTLGDKMDDPEKLRQMVEDKLLDGLRAVAATMNIDQLHEERQEFVQQVEDIVSKDLKKNGLILESVSLTVLDQTSFESLDPNNVFNAEGIKNATRTIAEAQKTKAEIEKDAAIKIANEEAETVRTTAAINRQTKEIEFEENKKTEEARAKQAAEIAAANEASSRASEEARIAREQAVEAADIARSKAIEEAEIAKAKAVQEAEIAKEREVELKRVERQEAVQIADIQRERKAEIETQDKLIAIAKKTEEEAAAKAEAEKARTLEVQAAEEVNTARETEIASRAKRVAIIKAEEEAEQEAVEIRVAALARKEAAADDAEAVTIEATAQRDATVLRATADRDAELLRAAGIEAVGLAEAKASEAAIQAENAVSADIIRMRINLRQIEQAPHLVKELMGPFNNIDSFRVAQISGQDGVLKPTTVNGEKVATGGAHLGGGSVVRDAMDGLMGMAASLPMITSVAKSVGMDLDTVLSGGAEESSGFAQWLAERSDVDGDGTGHVDPDDYSGDSASA